MPWLISPFLLAGVFKVESKKKEERVKKETR